MRAGAATYRALQPSSPASWPRTAGLNELPLLDRYFRARLIGGEGAFVMVAQDDADFAQAMAVKLAREIRAVPLSENVAPNPVHEARAEPGPFFRSAGISVPLGSAEFLNFPPSPF